MGCSGFLYGVLIIAIVAFVGSGSTPMPRPWYVYRSYLIVGTIVGLLRARFAKTKPAPPRHQVHPPPLRVPRPRRRWLKPPPERSADWGE